MAAPWFIVFWHKIVLSPPVWFIVEIFAKGPWKWSICSSLSLTSLLPLFAVVAVAFVTIIFAIISLVIVQCGLLGIAMASLVSSAITIAPLALFLTIFIYFTYKCALLAALGGFWILNVATLQATNIHHEVKGFVLETVRYLRSWKDLKKKRRREISSEVRSRAEQRIRLRNVQHFPDVETRGKTPELDESHQQQRGLLACLEILKQSFREESLSEECMDPENYLSACRSEKKSKGWLNWLNQSDTGSSVTGSECSIGTCPRGCPRLRYRFCTAEGSTTCTSCSSSSDIVSDSYLTADEWVAEDYIGNIIPDYRDTETKLYEALLKRDFCRGGDDIY